MHQGTPATMRQKSFIGRMEIGAYDDVSVLLY